MSDANTGKPSSDLLERKLPELLHFEKLIEDLKPFAQVHDLGSSRYKNQELALKALSLGSRDPKAPTLILFGGVHGLERIGSQVVLSLLQSVSELILWDKMTATALENIRLVFMPMVNPWGMYNLKRSNPNGVDIMRNAPVDAEDPTFLVGGHRYGPSLPWYRGNGELEAESQAVVALAKKEFFQSSAVISVDFHSGFGVQDQIWFPYAKTRRPFPELAQTYALTSNFARTNPHHFYKIEPQSRNYTTHGDLWDYLYDLYKKENSGTYLPLTLEMGSWMWMKKNPIQFFSSLGHFHPIKPHRHKRILRRHYTLFDFLIRSLMSLQTWTNLAPEQKASYESLAKELWYE